MNKSWFFEKNSKTDKLLVRLTKKKKETQITKISNERGDITTDFTEIRRFWKKCYEKLESREWEPWEEVCTPGEERGKGNQWGSQGEKEESLK